MKTLVDAEYFDEVVVRYLAGETTEAEGVWLQGQLEENEALRSRYLLQVRLETLLDEQDEAGAVPPARSETRGPLRRRPPVQIAFGIAAALVLAWGGWSWWAGSSETLPGGTLAEDSQPPPVAVLSRMVEAPTLQVAPGANMYPGLFSMEEGVVQIDLRSGVTLLAEGPCEVNLVDPMRVRCIAGGFRFRVPPQARGFCVETVAGEIVDLGTEFGLRINSASTHLAVFEGEVEARNGEDGDALQIQGGMQTAWHAQDPGGTWTAARALTGEISYPSPADLHQNGDARQHDAARAWDRYVETLQTDPALRLLYRFRAGGPWGNQVKNEAVDAPLASHGTLVGGRWSEGRWPDHPALDLKQEGDRMRFMDSRTYPDLSLAAWVRFDGLDRRNNSLMLSDGWEAGDVHWQVQNDGVLVLGVRKKRGVMAALYSPPDQIGQRHLGDWVLLCVTLDSATGRVVHYVNGRAVDAIEGQVPEVIRIGSAELGNWFNNTGSIRGLNGRIDFFAAWDRVLRPAEVAQLYHAGNPVR